MLCIIWSVNSIRQIQEAVGKLSPAERGELRQWLDLEQQICDVTESVGKLVEGHAIWWEIMNPKTGRFDGVRREYLNFFQPVCYSFVQGFYVISFKLFDSRADSTHIHSLINEVSVKNSGLANQLKSEIHNYPGRQRISTIRHKIFAHQDRLLNLYQILKRNPIVIKEMKETVFFIENIVSTVVDALGGDKKTKTMQTFSERENSATKATLQILNALARDLKRENPNG